VEFDQSRIFGIEQARNDDGIHFCKYLFFYSGFISFKETTSSFFVNFGTKQIDYSSLVARAFLVGYSQKSGTSISIRVFAKAVTESAAEFAVEVGDSM
jgi:hypothetical protein